MIIYTEMDRSDLVYRFRLYDFCVIAKRNIFLSRTTKVTYK